MTAAPPRHRRTARPRPVPRVRRRPRPLSRLAESWHTAGPLAAPLLALAAMQWVGMLASPALLERAPLLLAFLSPRAPFLIYASATSPLAVFVVVASIRLLLADPVNYCLGRRIGPLVCQRIGRRGRIGAAVVRVSERAIDRCGVLGVACRPNGLMLALAGSRRLHPVATGAAAVLGTVSYASALALTADAAADPLRGLVTWLHSALALVRAELVSGGPAVGAVVAATAAAALAGAGWRARDRQRPAA